MHTHTHTQRKQHRLFSHDCTDRLKRKIRFLKMAQTPTVSEDDNHSLEDD